MENITGMIGAFIAISIMLTIGISILDNTSADCKTRTGYNATHTAQSTGWASTCTSTNDQTQSSYGLLTLTLFVLAAVAVVGIVRFLG